MHDSQTDVCHVVNFGSDPFDGRSMMSRLKTLAIGCPTRNRIFLLYLILNLKNMRNFVVGRFQLIAGDLTTLNTI